MLRDFYGPKKKNDFFFLLCCQKIHKNKIHTDFRERQKEEFSLFVITQMLTKGMGLQTVVQTHYGIKTHHLS